MATDSEIPTPLLCKQVKVYEAINAVTSIVAAEPQPPKGEEPLTPEQQEALDEAMAEYRAALSTHRVALEQARAAQAEAVKELYDDPHWEAGWADKARLEKLAREKIKAPS